MTDSKAQQQKLVVTLISDRELTQYEILAVHQAALDAVPDGVHASVSSTTLKEPELMEPRPIKCEHPDVRYLALPQPAKAAGSISCIACGRVFGWLLHDDTFVGENGE